MNKIINFFIKTIKFILLVALILFTSVCCLYCFSEGFFIFMIPFLISLALYYLLNIKIRSKNWLIEIWLIEIIKIFFFHVFIVLIILSFLSALFGFLGYNNLSLINTIYCDKLDESSTGNIMPTNSDASVNTINTHLNTPDTIPKTDSSKITLESDKYYHIRKDYVDKAIEIISKGVEQGVDKIVANVGSAAEGGTAAATILKSSITTGSKLLLAGASAVIVAASTKIGITVGENLLSRSSTNTTSDVLTKMDLDIIPSPTGFFVPSFFDSPEILIPLEQLIRCQFFLNFLILFSVLILIGLLFNKLFLSNNILVSFISRFLNKNTVIKFNAYKLKIDKFNNSFFFLLFWINAFTLLFNLFISLVISCELTFDLDYYLTAHN